MYVQDVTATPSGHKAFNLQIIFRYFNFLAFRISILFEFVYFTCLFNCKHTSNTAEDEAVLVLLTSMMEMLFRDLFFMIKTKLIRYSNYYNFFSLSELLLKQKVLEVVKRLNNSIILNEKYKFTFYIYQEKQQ